MIIGLPQVRSRKRRRSVRSRQISLLSRPMTPFSATAATIVSGRVMARPANAASAPPSRRFFVQPSIATAPSRR